MFAYEGFGWVVKKARTVNNITEAIASIEQMRIGKRRSKKKKKRYGSVGYGVANGWMI